MANSEVEEFARIIVHHVRDRAIEDCDAANSPDRDSRQSKRWRQLGIPREAIAAIIPDVVDEVLFALLDAIDNGDLRLKFISESGAEVDLASAGRREMAGWYMGVDSWRERFSGQRFYDDVSDHDE